jgi:hypothetical protein
MEEPQPFLRERKRKFGQVLNSWDSIRLGPGGPGVL